MNNSVLIQRMYVHHQHHIITDGTYMMTGKQAYDSTLLALKQGYRHIGMYVLVA